MEFIKIAEITPAHYNPRKITEDSFSELQGSLRELGFILPIIVNSDNMTIVAGHQRTKACKKVGIEEVPVFYVKDVNLQAEIQFNQIHNGIEYEPAKLGKLKNVSYEPGFYTDVPYDSFEIEESQATFVKDICKLILEFGDALCAIVCGDEVVFGNNYIRACQIHEIPCHISVIPAEKRMLFDYYFKKQYGYFSYDHIDRHDFVQGLAQMTNKQIQNSKIYGVALPFITASGDKNVSILDFGCGKAFSITHVKTVMGYRRAIGLEFFNHNRKGISVQKGQMMINDLIKHVQKYGKFDYVICDSVLNSVNSQEAEECVLACLMLFCKPGGSIFFCGRSKESVDKVMEQKRNITSDAYSAKFLDENGLTGYMREGQWYFQKFHTKEDVEAIIERLGLEVIANRRDVGMWQVGGRKTKELTDEEYMHAIDFEFNMKLPNDQRYGRHNDIRKLFGYPEI